LSTNNTNYPKDIPPVERYIWEDESTLVERRRKLVWYRVGRFLGCLWFPALIIGVILLALFNAAVMRLIINSFPLIVRMIVMTGAIIGQFAAMFWFLGRSRMYAIYPGQEGVGFEDYRGQPEVLEQARQIVKLLRGVDAFEKAGGEPLNGLLFEGPPGTGKTWLAQAISTEAGVPFFFVDASSMNSMFIGIAPIKVANIYRKARKAAREYGASVIFIDEIDAIGARGGVAEKREGGVGGSIRLPMMFGGMGAGMGLLSTLLIEMSGFSLEHGWMARKKRGLYKFFMRRDPPKLKRRILTIGATNRIQALDAALLRPGRFDKKIRIDAPDLEGRRDIIAYYLEKIAHDETVDPEILAMETRFYTPADIKYLLNEALRYALFDNRTSMTYNDFRLAQPEHEAGLRQPIRNLAPEAKYGIAAHEAGHALAVRLYMPHYRIARITIIRQGGALGHVTSYPANEEYDYLSTYDFLMNRLRVAVGGKAGEMEFVNTGAQSLGVGGDFGNIRHNLQAMAATGMFGQFAPDGKYTPDMKQAMEDTFTDVLHEVRLAFRLHREMGLELIDLLVEKDELLANEVEAFFDKYGFHTPNRAFLQDESKTNPNGAA
jgi:cell division protease FtsH